MRRVLREREFRLLWLGQSASTIGDRLVFVALALYVTEIGSPTDVGIVLAAHAVPFVAFLILGGVWADRLPRHLVMVATDVIRAAMHGLLALLILTGTVEIWHIVVIEAVFGAAEAFVRVCNLPWPAAIALFAAGAARGFLVAFFVFAGMGLSLFDVWWQTALAQRIPPHALSRVSSYDWMGSLALLPLGCLLAGPVGEALGASEVLIVGGAIAVGVSALGFAIPDFWRLRALPAPG